MLYCAQLARMMINNFDINLHKEKYQVLMQDLVRGYPKAGKGPSGQVRSPWGSLCHGRAA